MASLIVPPEGLEVGAVRVYRRRDGLFIVFDGKRAIGKCTVSAHRHVEDAIESARRLCAPPARST